MQTSVLHGYYQVGGRSVRRALLDAHESINRKIEGTVHTAHDEALTGNDPESIQLTRVHRTRSIPAFHYDNPDSLKQSLFFIRGRSGRVGFVHNQLDSHRAGSKFASRKQNDVPWTQQGFAQYLLGEYSLTNLAYDRLYYDYKGINSLGRAEGEVRMKLDESAECNQVFFEAQGMCLRGLTAIAGHRVHIEPANSVRIGTIDIQNTTQERIENAVDDASLMLAGQPLIAEIGDFALKYRTMASA